MIRQHSTTAFFLVLFLTTLACGQIVTPVPAPTATVSPVPSSMPPRATQTPLPARETPSATVYTVCNTDALNLRALPGEEFPKVASPIEHDTPVYVYVADVPAADGGRWSFIVFDGIGYWVNAKYICEAQ
jgi:hypothetical protein